MERYTKYEIARMIGSRALQIAMGAPFLVKLSEEDLEKLGFNPIRIAEKELEAGVLPLAIKRPLPKMRGPMGKKVEAKVA
ncbi:DNA-directed RNA polymerase subunit K [Candidatus Woesearchaeota archaeon]|nr:DNA-directed RNA polymerase subunit K [Candidatus Woesearchaeota archaeon]